MKTEAERAGDQALGVFVAHARKSLGMSVHALAERAHVAPSTISRLERGTRSMRTAGLSRVADVLGIDFTELLAARGITVSSRTHGTLYAYLRSTLYAYLRSTFYDWRAKR